MLFFNREFHPVGQGAFYTEIINGSNKKTSRIVFDCGTKSSQNHLEKAIDKTFAQGDVIDILFLSHLHFDHVSGVEYLKNRCKIKVVVLPIVSPLEKILIQLDLRIHELESIILDPSNYFDEDSKIIFVKRIDGEESSNQFELLLNDELKSQEISSGTILKINSSFSWEYHIFNSKIDNTLNSFEKLLLNEEIDIMRIQDVNYFKSIEKKLFYCYGKLKGKHNLNSLVVYSTLNKNFGFNEVEILSNEFTFFSNVLLLGDLTGCLYTGDTSLKESILTQTILDKIKSYKTNTAILQIPHHGSIRNFNNQSLALLPTLYFGICIISVGSNNKKHPSNEVLKKIFLNDKLPVIIKENSKTTYKQIIQFKVRTIGI